MVAESDIPQDLRDYLAAKGGGEWKWVLERAAENDPDLRRHVRHALEADGITVDPFHLELALSRSRLYDIDAEDSIPVAREERQTEEQDFQQKRLTEFFTGLQEELPKLERAEWRNTILNGMAYELLEYYQVHYLLEKGPEWTNDLDAQIDPAIIKQIMDSGEDPKFIALLIANMWGNRRLFHELINVLGADILQWDDRRSLIYNRLFSSIKPDKILCEEMHVEPAGLATIEPWTGDRKDDHYDMYGGRVSEVTVYSVAFVPRNPKQARLLQKQVELAVRALTKTEFPFTVPAAHYTRNSIAYERPKLYKSDELSVGGEKTSWVSFLEYQKFMHDDLLGDGKFSQLEASLKEKNIYDYWREKTGIKHSPSGYFTEGAQEAGYLCALLDRGIPLPDYVPAWFTKALKEEQDRQDGVRYTHVDSDGRVVLNDRLALEDVWDLYRLSRGFIEPSEQIAVALNVARYTEERGPIKSPGDIGSDHDYQDISMDSTLGNMHKSKPEEILVNGLAQIAMMAGTKEIDMRASFEQILSLSKATLDGFIVDPTGLFPTYKAITDGRKGSAIMPYKEVVADRARTMLDAIAVMFGEDDPNKPLRERFEVAVQSARGVARMENLVATSVWQYKFDLKMREYRSRDFSHLIHGDDPGKDAMALKISDVLSGNFERFAKDHGYYDAEYMTDEKGNNKRVEDPVLDAVREKMEAETKRAETARKHNALLGRTGLVVWSGEVPPQIDRGYANTTHRSRSHHSPYARLELPEDLQPFIRAQEERAGRDRFQLDAPDVIFGGGTSSRPRPS